MTNDENTICKADNIKTTVQSSNLMEELGQVEYVFSDKTGTLTKNIMEFKNISINGQIYGNKKDIKDISKYPVVTNVDFKDSELFKDLENTSSPNHKALKEFLIELAVCHTIITEEKEGKVHYNASSPDELALVNFAKFVGSEFIGIDDENNLSIEYQKTPMKYKLLHTLEFNSTRKRMSVIVRTPEGKILLYCKGADSIIIERMHQNGDPYLQKTKSNLVEFANIGLRTLVLAKKEIDTKLYEDWAARYKQGLLASEGRDEIIAKLQEEIELGLFIVGCTAIEDKLQDDVGITIAKIKESGIKVWVLTGDKIETAINIGYSCRLLSDDLNQLQVIENTVETLRNSLDAKIKEIEKVDPNNSNYALIIAGDSLTLATKEKMTDKVIKIAQACNSVLACRVSPKQKQEIVSMVRAEKPKVVTLAIGDGANDVNMIIAAHIGVGIRGLEGQQVRNLKIS
jgi:phospholipid-transporting ATPase